MERIKEIKKVLQDKLGELTNRVADIEKDLQAPHDDNWTEDASESQNDETQEGIEMIAVNEIEKIKSALQKIENGTYGLCQSCGKMISIKRLQALPYALKCLDCVDA